MDPEKDDQVSAQTLRPFKFGDHVDQHWARMRLCPTCGEKAVSTCRCIEAHSRCKNGHHWYNRQGIVTEGKGAH